MIPVLTVSVPATEALMGNTVCRYDGGYDGTTPRLGVVTMDFALGETASVVVRGLGRVKLADSEDPAVGEVLGIDATGHGVANASANKVDDFKPVFMVEDGYAHVIL